MPFAIVSPVRYHNAPFVIEIHHETACKVFQLVSRPQLGWSEPHYTQFPKKWVCAKRYETKSAAEEALKTALAATAELDGEIAAARKTIEETDEKIYSFKKARSVLLEEYLG